MATNIKIGVDLDGLTFGDLYDFVDFARGANVPRENEVAQVLWSEEEPDRGVQKFEMALPGGRELRKPPNFADAELDKLIWALDDVLDKEGDARGQMAELSEIRDRLRG
jgi:hypothetical protein